MDTSWNFERWLDLHTDDDDAIHSVFSSVERSLKHHAPTRSGGYQVTPQGHSKILVVELASPDDPLILDGDTAVVSFLEYMNSLYIGDGGIKEAYRLRHDIERSA